MRIPHRHSGIVDKALILSFGLVAAAAGVVMGGGRAAAPVVTHAVMPVTRDATPVVPNDTRATGACCLADGSCAELTQADCQSANGTFHTGGDCSNTGSCTFSDDCIVTTQQCCNDMQGTWTASGTCPDTGCVPSFSTPADGLAEWPVDFGEAADYPVDTEGDEPRAIFAFVDPNHTLFISGSAASESIRLVISSSNPNMLRVLSPEDGSGQAFSFALSTISRISIGLGDGDDLLVFDDSQGVISSLKPCTIDGGGGQNTIIARTGTLTLAQVQGLIGTLNTAQSLMAEADALRQIAGTVSTFPNSGGLAADAIGFVSRIESDFVTPSRSYIEDLKAQMIDPATQTVVDTRDQVLAAGLPLISRAYNELAAAALALQNDANVNIVIPALQLLDTVHTQGVSDANDVSGCAAGQLSGPQATQFMANVDALVEQIVAISDACPPDPNEPPEQPDVCPQIETLVECIEREIETYEMLADICEDEGDAFEGELNNLESSADNIEAYSETFEDAIDNFEGMVDPNYYDPAKAYEAYVESFAANAETYFGNTAAAFDTRADVQFRQAADAYAADADAQLRAAADQLQAQADQLSLDAEAIIQAASALLGPGAAEEPRASSCAGIVTTVTINAGPVVICGAVGTTVHGTSPSNLIVGGPGNDILYGNTGPDIIFGAGGTNEIHGGAGSDILIGGNGVDCIYGEDGIDLILGRGGNDEIDGGDGTDIIIAGSGDDKVWGRGGMDLIIGNDGNDMLDGGHCVDVIIGGNGNDALIGGDGQTVSLGSVSLELGDLLFAGGGNDTIYGDHLSKDGTGVDLAFGGDGDDKMYLGDGGDLTIGSFTIKIGNIAFGGPGNDEIESKKGVDALFGGPGNDTLSAGEGDDITFPNSTFEIALGDFLFGGDGTDTLNGDDSAAGATQDIDFLFGGDGPDTLNAYDGGTVVFSSNFQMKFGNLLFGGAGADTLNSGAGVDFVFGGPDNDTINAGKGDTLVFGTSLIIDLGDFIFGQGGDDVINANVANQPASNADDGIDFIIGGPGDDHIYGDGGGLVVIGTTAVFEFGNIIFGGDGNDLIRAGYQVPIPSSPSGGIDLLVGGDGNDDIDGADGAYVVVITGAGVFAVDFGDIVIGGTGDDTINTGSGMDFIFCGSGDDSATTRGGIDFVLGGDGDDTLDVGDGGTIIIPPAIPITFGNIVFGGDGSDTIYSAGDNDPLFPDIDLLCGNKCDDTIFAGDGFLDIVIGGPGNDTLYGEDGPDLIIGGKHNDTIFCGAGLLDIAIGARGDDTIFGGDGTDLILGGKDNDILFGDDGVDIVLGGKGGDIVHGGNQPDFVMGNKGGDDVYGDDGFDFVLGGQGDDYVHGGPGTDFVFGGPGRDFCYGDGGADIVFGGPGEDMLFGGDDPDLLFGGPQNDRLSGDAQLDVYFGGEGNDVIEFESGTTIAFGGIGNDVVLGSPVFDLEIGGDGDDWLYGGDGGDLLLGRGGYNVLYGGAGGDFMFGGPLDDVLFGGSERDRMFGRQGDDCLDSGPGDDRVFGNRGDDQVRSGDDGTDQDRLFGGFGSDTLWGCNFADKLRGGPGSDNKDPNNCTGCSAAPPTCGEILGTIYVDRDGNGSLDGGLAGATVYVDVNNNGQLDSGEPFAVTPDNDPNTFYNEAGTYRLAWFASGPGSPSYKVRVVNRPGYAFLAPGGVQTVNLSVPCARQILNFALVDNCHVTQGTPNPCVSCQCPDGYIAVPSVVINQQTCTSTGEPCSTDADCGCGDTCVSTYQVLDCACVPQTFCLMASDDDNFAANTLPIDQIIMEPEFAAWLGRPGGNNAQLHGGQPRPFDVVGPNDWDFGYSFINLPSITHPTLTFLLAATDALSTNDSLSLCFTPGSPNPTFAWGASIGVIELANGGNGTWNLGEVELFTLDLEALPVSGGAPVSIISQINAHHRLDIYMQDDTAPDFFRLCYQTVQGNQVIEYAPFGERPTTPDRADQNEAAASSSPPRETPLRSPDGRAPLPPAPAPPPFDTPQSRYISFTPTEGNQPVAYEITVPPCRRGWVGRPRLYQDTTVPVENWVSDVVDAPFYQVWDMDVVHVRGCVIAPNQIYDVVTVDPFGVASTPLQVPTAQIWGDMNLDGVVDFFDLDIILQRANHQSNDPPMVFVDLAGVWPDFQCDQTDVNAMLDALNGNPYPPAFFGISDISSCPANPPCKAPCGDINGDGLINFADFVAFAGCMSGPGMPITGGCFDADIDQDGDVDMVEFANLQAAFGTP